MDRFEFISVKQARSIEKDGCSLLCGKYWFAIEPEIVMTVWVYPNRGLYIIYRKEYIFLYTKLKYTLVEIPRDSNRRMRITVKMGRKWPIMKNILSKET
jgi:hypothetical protein